MVAFGFGVTLRSVSPQVFETVAPRDTHEKVSVGMQEQDISRSWL